jgi:hypothetical protein
MSATSKMVILLFSITSSFSWSTLPSVFLTYVPSVQHFNRHHIASEHWIPIKNSCSSLSLLPRSNVWHFRSFCSIFTQFKEEFDVDMMLYQVLHFPGMPKSQAEQHTLTLNKTHSLITCTKVSFQTGNGSAEVYIYLRTEVCASNSRSSHGQPRN